MLGVTLGSRYTSRLARHCRKPIKRLNLEWFSGDPNPARREETIMPPIPLNDAIERLAQAVEVATPDDLVEMFAELYPEKPVPDISETKAAGFAQNLAQYVRTGIAPEEVVDLWNVVFSAGRNVYYNEEDGTLRPNSRELGYAG